LVFGNDDPVFGNDDLVFGNDDLVFGIGDPEQPPSSKFAAKKTA
jgi:hypothetical protein